MLSIYDLMSDFDLFQRGALGGRYSWLCERRLLELKPLMTRSGTPFGFLLKVLVSSVLPAVLAFAGRYRGAKAS